MCETCLSTSFLVSHIGMTVLLDMAAVRSATLDTLRTVGRVAGTDIVTAQSQLQLHLLSYSKYYNNNDNDDNTGGNDKNDNDTNLCNSNNSTLHSIVTFGIEQAFRLYLQDILDCANDDGLTLQQAGLDTFLNLSIWAACPNKDSSASAYIDINGGACIAPSLVFALLEDVFEGSSLRQCEQAFDCLIKHATIIASKHFTNGNKLPILRTFIQLLRRLSRGVNSVFCGRVLLLMAWVLPLADRSGVNLLGHFNTSNVTNFEKLTGKSSESAGHTSNDDDVSMNITSDEDQYSAVDLKFYTMFWSLQAYFSEPNKCFQAKDWKELTEALDTVLATLASCSVVAAAGTDDPQSQSMTEFPKFLTSSRLLNLQMRDASFRRTICMQCLILFQYLDPAKSVMTSASGIGATPADDGDLGKSQLKDQQRLMSLKSRVIDILISTPPHGPRYHSIATVIMRREETWTKWKDEKDSKLKCRSYERDVIASNPLVSGGVGPLRKKRKQGGDSISTIAASLQGKILYGALDGDVSGGGSSGGSSSGNDFLASLSASDRPSSTPSLAVLLDPLFSDLDPSNAIEDAYHHKNNKQFCWRALRLIIRSRFDLITLMVNASTTGGSDGGCHGIDKIAEKLLEEIDPETFQSIMKAREKLTEEMNDQSKTVDERDDEDMIDAIGDGDADVDMAANDALEAEGKGDDSNSDGEVDGEGEGDDGIQRDIEDNGEIEGDEGEEGEEGEETG